MYAGVPITAPARVSSGCAMPLLSLGIRAGAVDVSPGSPEVAARGGSTHATAAVTANPATAPASPSAHDARGTWVASALAHPRNPALRFGLTVVFALEGLDSVSPLTWTGCSVGVGDSSVVEVGRSPPEDGVVVVVDGVVEVGVVVVGEPVPETGAGVVDGGVVVTVVVVVGVGFV